MLKTCTQEFFQQPSHLWFRLCYRLVGTFNNINLVANVDSFLCTYVFAGPRSRSTHWKQTVLYLEDVLTICEGETIVGSMTVAPNKKNPRDVDIMLKYSLNGRRCNASRVQYYKMR